MVKMIMHGCNGKMGQVITKIVKEDANAEIVAGIDKYIRDRGSRISKAFRTFQTENHSVSFRKSR